MKIKEVEVFNTIYQELGTQMPSPDDTVSGVLTNDGEVLTMTVGPEVGRGLVRRVAVSYMLIDFNNNLYTDENLGVITDISPTGGSSHQAWPTYEFQLERVLKVPINFPQEYAGVEVEIDSLTSEANVDKTWGVQTLVYPFMTRGNSTLIYPETTDGWYRLSVLDVPKWDGSTEFVAGDIVFYEAGGEFMIAAVDNVSTEPLNPDETWSVPTDEDFKMYNISLNRTSDEDAVFRLLSDLLITRGVKQRFVFECIKASSFNTEDNDVADFTLSRVQALREASIAYLESGDPIRAVSAILRVPTEYNALLKDDITQPPENTFTL